MRARAVWRGQVLAESDSAIRLEGNHDFLRDSLAAGFRESATTTVCPWKGRAHYYDVVVDGVVNRDAAWYYPDPRSAAG